MNKDGIEILFKDKDEELTFFEVQTYGGRLVVTKCDYDLVEAIDLCENLYLTERTAVENAIRKAQIENSRLFKTINDNKRVIEQAQELLTKIKAT